VGLSGYHLDIILLELSAMSLMVIGQKNYFIRRNASSKYTETYIGTMRFIYYTVLHSVRRSLVDSYAPGRKVAEAGGHTGSILSFPVNPLNSDISMFSS